MPTIRFRHDFDEEPIELTYNPDSERYVDLKCLTKRQASFIEGKYFNPELAVCVKCDECKQYMEFYPEFDYGLYICRGCNTEVEGPYNIIDVAEKDIDNPNWREDEQDEEEKAYIEYIRKEHGVDKISLGNTDTTEIIFNDTRYEITLMHDLDESDASKISSKCFDSDKNCVYCDGCKTHMILNEFDEFKCEKCGITINHDELTRMKEDYIDYMYFGVEKEDDIPPGCLVCGGPYPDCISSCNMFDD